MDDFNWHDESERAFGEILAALGPNDLIKPRWARGDLVPAQEDLCQWLIENTDFDGAALLRTVQAGKLNAWFCKFANAWANDAADEMSRRYRAATADAGW